jgi:ArsR family transcriptional regulator, lead/cadmium/zinc/bismuth-responsive transcriptional repressor
MRASGSMVGGTTFGSLRMTATYKWRGRPIPAPAFDLLDSPGTTAYHSNMGANERSAAVARRTTSADLCNVPCFKEDLVTGLRGRMPPDEEFEEARVVFAALADRRRLKLLHALSGGEELCVCDVAHVLRVSVSVASHHLRKLRDLGVLKYRTDGKMSYYSLRDRFAAELVAQTLCQVKK